MALRKKQSSTWHTNFLDMLPVDPIPDDVDLAVNMQVHLLELRTSFTKPYLVIFYEHKSIVRPTYALIQPAANFNLAHATVRAHVLEYSNLNPTLNYFNNMKV